MFEFFGSNHLKLQNHPKIMKRDMRWCSLLLILVYVFHSGCTRKERPSESARQEQPLPDQLKAQSLVGTWSVSIPDGKEKMTNLTIELGSNERWTLWRPIAQPTTIPLRPVPESIKPAESGSWFVRKGTLFLRIEKSATDKVIPGMAAALDLKSVSSNKVSVMIGKDELSGERIR